MALAAVDEVVSVHGFTGIADDDKLLAPEFKP